MGQYNRSESRDSGGRGFGGGSRGGFGGGGGRSGGGFGGDRGRPQMHQATCAECGNQCEVPFKPTGEKPVYCSNCFESSGRGMSRPKRDDSRPRFDEKPSSNNNELKAEMEKLNNKLDRILKILAPVISSESKDVKEVKEESEKPAKKEVKKAAAKAPAKKAAAKKPAKKKK